MIKIKKFFKAIILILLKPWLLNNVLNDTSEWRKYILNKYKKPDGFPVVDIVDILGDIDETIDPYAFLDGGSLPTDLVLLKNLVRSIEGCSYFEIGTWRGESIANIAPYAKECCTLNLSNKAMSDMGYSDDYIKQYGVLSRRFENIAHLRGNSLDFDFVGLNRTFDLIFIDGDHHYDMVRNDSHKVFTNLVHENTIVVWHDYARNPETIRYEVMAGILDGTPKQYHDKLYFVSNSLCAIYTKRPLKSKTFVTPVHPERVFEIRVKSKKLEE